MGYELEQEKMFLIDAPAAQWTKNEQAGLDWLAQYCDTKLKLD